MAVRVHILHAHLDEFNYNTGSYLEQQGALTQKLLI